MSTAPRLSIGLPVYNGEKYLPASLDAVLGQTYDDFELIIADNASTDSTEEICRETSESAISVSPTTRASPRITTSW
jgi:glycosyltransferase involved in cell wall biosynthesis